MRNETHKKIISLSFALVLAFAQFQFLQFLVQPQVVSAQANEAAIATAQIQAKINAVAVDANVSDVTRAVEDAARGIASAIVDRIVTEFVQQLVAKYQIRNFLYYDKALTDYYLNNYVENNISDPDLRRIYTLMEQGYVSGVNTGTTNAPDPKDALIPQLNVAINNFYIKEGGIDPNKITNPQVTDFATPQDYWGAAQSFFINSPSATAQNLQGQFGAFQSSASSASQLEIAVGNGLKAGRIIGGTCSLGSGAKPTSMAPSSDKQLGGISKFLADTGLVSVASADITPTPPPGSTVLNPPSNGLIPGASATPGSPAAGGTSTLTNTPPTCQAAGGTWQPSLVDQARSFITNPTVKVNQWLQAGLSSVFDAKYNPNNFWYVIGQATGSFLFTQLGLDKSNDLLSDGGPSVGSSKPSDIGDLLNESLGIDIDGDGLADGFDINDDGVIDICVYGGTAPNCVGSATITGNTPQLPCTQLGIDEQNFMLPLLNGTPPADPQSVVDQTNAKFASQFTADETGAAFYPAGTNGVPVDTIGLPEFYVAKDANGGTSWRVQSRCGGTTSPGTGEPKDSPILHHPHPDVVYLAIKQLQNEGADLTGNCGALLITETVAWNLSQGTDSTDTQAGLLKQSGGISCNGFASNIIMFPDGYSYNILTNAGQANVSQAWAWAGLQDVNLYVAAFNPLPACDVNTTQSSVVDVLDNMISDLQGFDFTKGTPKQTGLTEDGWNTLDSDDLSSLGFKSFNPTISKAMTALIPNYNTLLSNIDKAINEFGHPGFGPTNAGASGFFDLSDNQLLTGSQKTAFQKAQADSLQAVQKLLFQVSLTCAAASTKAATQ